MNGDLDSGVNDGVALDWTQGAQRIGRPRVLNHLVKGTIFGLLTWAVVACFLILPRDIAPLLPYICCVVIWPFVAGFTRNVHALIARPHFILSRQGIILRCWRPVGFPSLALFRFWYRIIDRAIPWSDYQGCETFTHTTNGMRDWQQLTISTATGSCVIGWDVFRPGVKRLQQELLDYVERTFRQPLREESRVAEFCRLRFRTPLRIDPAGSDVAVPLIFLGAALVSAGAVWAYVPSFNTGWVALPIFLVLCVFVSLSEWTATWGKRVLELRDEGLALGNSPNKMRVIPWGTIAFVRRRAERNAYQRKVPADFCSGLEVRLRDGSSVVLPSKYKRSLNDICDFLDPPIANLARAWELLADGHEIEAAAADAGLPSRG